MGILLGLRPKPALRSRCELPPPEPERQLRVRNFGLTDSGRVRPANEDHFLIAELTRGLHVRQSSVPQPSVQPACLPRPPMESDGTGHLLVVADGMGGHRAGEYASRLTVQALVKSLGARPEGAVRLRGPEGETLVRNFHDAIEQAQRILFAEGARHPECRGMGTTLTLAYVSGRDLFVAHVGDSRCYLLRGGELRRLTQDHTMTEEMLRLGVIRPAQAATHIYRHVVTNCLGGSEPALRVEMHRTELEPGDVLLLCSDGLTDMVPDERIRDILLAEPNPEEACASLVAEANEQGGKDNITVVLARCESADVPAPDWFLPAPVGGL
jgi:protein phosphatase